MVSGLLFYKPQLAVVLAGMMLLDLGWRAALGTAITALTLLIVSMIAMPGALNDFLVQVPANLHFVQEQSAYPWARHATFRAFWRLLLQGEPVGQTWTIVNVLSGLGMAAVGVLLVLAFFKGRGTALHPWRRDRFIAATIAATPLLMPFYFDYDLLLLAAPAVLLAREIVLGNEITVSDRWLIGLLATLYGWLMINPDVADQTRVNLAVPLLAGITILMIQRINAPATLPGAALARRPIFSSPIPARTIARR
jgi:hypothetical protein